MIFEYGSIDSKLQGNIFNRASIYLIKNTIYNLHLKRLKQEIKGLHKCTKLRWNWANDEIINFIKLNYLLNSFNYLFFNVNHYIICGFFDLPGLCRPIAICIWAIGQTDDRYAANMRLI